jgi:putative flippase GtrA
MATPQTLPNQPEGVALVLRYAAFAAVATAVNLLVQAVILSLYAGRLHLLLALLAGTIAGLLPKYLLDKRWIFDDRSAGLDTHARKFTLYTLMSLGTTVIFWATEILFDRLGGGGRLHYLGAVIGLAIGYWAKYHLDRRITFRPQTPSAPHLLAS